ncbi:aminotransferase class I/II-fold pyridoxal phosphate-dependent enzyme [Tepidimicrobium xylanilyticum]|uniref:Lysine decarboxylase n=1 Tax=Tepidimicrobium xylanilyticum TaxID=1123352 RepID=A0A1H2WND0_9FIRM|nr:aminotransferase class I/II-fold pyridoxal phosphate-dependent enzyme [Tepidimicrobium xylanilyticum]GMG95206.1 hypothetical protein EN5CB1_00320 [Tepidimicrobium xylanilyticum]SDW81499.1 lysine decarboxylase [Tepidimicrobium xylanilyticum]
MKTPILDKLIKLMDKKLVSFHMPGHKGRNTIINWGELVPQIDVTELPGLDNLHDSRGVIKESLTLAAKTFGAKETLYSVNGTTGGIYIALAAITNPGDKVLIQRNSHKSIYNGAILNRLDIDYVYPHYNEKYGLFTGINPESIEEKLRANSDIKVVVITYPNYYGICSHIKRIADIVHKYDRILLVDEAHGSHFIFSEKLPLPALKAGADLSVQSIHKTLPSFTQTSMVHVGSNRVNIEKLKSMSSLYQTTSPSYLFMASLEIARAYMEGEGRERLEKNILLIDELICKLKDMKGVYLFTGDEEDKTIFDKDITKILFRMGNVPGPKISQILRKDYNIYLEMEDDRYCLALASVMNEERDFHLLGDAIMEIADNIMSQEGYIERVPIMPKPEIVLPLYEAFYRSKRAADLKDAAGKISGTFLIPYPPGIPVLCPGERITIGIIEYIEFLIEKGIEIIGLIGYNKEKIEVID